MQAGAIKVDKFNGVYWPNLDKQVQKQVCGLTEDTPKEVAPQALAGAEGRRLGRFI